MAFDITSIQKGRKNLPPRIVLLGTPKVGKTTFAGGADQPVLIPVKGEEGADDLDIAKFPTVKTYTDFMEALSTLAQSDHDFRTVVIDSSSTLEPIIWDHVCEQHKVDSIEKVMKGYGKGYIEALKIWRNIMDALDWLRSNKGMASIIIGHVAVKPFNDPMTDPYDQYVWNINKLALAAWQQWADCVLFAKKQTFQKTETEGDKKIRRGTGTDNHMLYTKERPSHPGGGRGVYGRLPYELPLEYAKFKEEVEKV